MPTSSWRKFLLVRCKSLSKHQNAIASSSKIVKNGAAKSDILKHNQKLSDWDPRNTILVLEWDRLRISSSNEQQVGPYIWRCHTLDSSQSQDHGRRKQTGAVLSGLQPS